MSRRSLRFLVENLALSTISIAICSIAGYLVSFPINQVLNPEAADFKSPALGGEVRSIDTAKLDKYERVQGNSILLAAGTGILAAQVAFLVGHLPAIADTH